MRAGGISAGAGALAANMLEESLLVRELSHRIEILMFSARVSSRRKKFDHLSDVRERLEWLSAPDLVRYHTLTLAHRVIHSCEPETLSRVFRSNGGVRDRRTRQDGLFHVPRCKTRFGQRQFAAEPRRSITHCLNQCLLI